MSQGDELPDEFHNEGEKDVLGQCDGPFAKYSCKSKFMRFFSFFETLLQKM